MKGWRRERRRENRRKGEGNRKEERRYIEGMRSIN